MGIADKNVKSTSLTEQDFQDTGISNVGGSGSLSPINVGSGGLLLGGGASSSKIEARGANTINTVTRLTDYGAIGGAFSLVEKAFKGVESLANKVMDRSDNQLQAFTRSINEVAPSDPVQSREQLKTVGFIALGLGTLWLISKVGGK